MVISRDQLFVDYKSTNFFIKMKLLLVFLGLLAVVFGDDGYCYNDVVAACKPAGGSELVNCNAKYGEIDAVEYDLQSYVNKHITHSFQYLLLSSHFGNFEKNRVGFQKLFRSLSDTAWNDGIDLIKYMTKRGGKMDFISRRQEDSLVQTRDDTYELYELESLAKAVDIQVSYEFNFIKKMSLFLFLKENCIIGTSQL